MIFQMKLSSITSLTMGLLSYELRTTCRIGLQGEKKNGKKKHRKEKPSQNSGQSPQKKGASSFPLETRCTRPP